MIELTFWNKMAASMAAPRAGRKFLPSVPVIHFSLIFLRVTNLPLSLALRVGLCPPFAALDIIKFWRMISYIKHRLINYFSLSNLNSKIHIFGFMQNFFWSWVLEQYWIYDCRINWRIQNICYQILSWKF